MCLAAAKMTLATACFQAHSKAPLSANYGLKDRAVPKGTLATATAFGYKMFSGFI